MKIRERIVFFCVKVPARSGHNSLKSKSCRKKNVLTERRLKEIQEEYDALTVQNENLKDINRSLKELSQSEKDKKVLAQKSNSYLRKEISDLRTNLKQCVDSDFLLESSSHEICNNSIKQMKLLLDEKEQQINELQEEAIEKKKIDTRNANGCFTDNVRLCVMELAALEVATEKVSKVIQCVSSHLHNYSLKNDELPNSTTVQTIVDEGHFIAKTYIAEKLDESSTWGLSRDGTTRKKKKILDTTVTLDDGKVISLGFTQVSRETASAITDVTKSHLKELSKAHEAVSSSQSNLEDINISEEFIVNSLEKLAFTMSDRAANEKLADKLLTEWRENMLLRCRSETEVSSVKHFHCMAHVLLGFHRYVVDEIKSVEKENFRK
ncbi:uncharacterized protein LOC123524811 [Mercenaria mercenaria]|uniref:uncharacterized protein LOC123524811 n=1 Tax=Mercenaria mercenaria TaxID=6596 RepID=UPI00234EC77B|nr:uncharacterized protein LOC123524811 [Mercenaria mercenaria]